MLPDILLQEVIKQAKQLNINISDCIAPQVRINHRAKTRLGCCIKKGEHFTIELSASLDTPQEMRETLAHEILHTCYGCQNHGKRWRSYAQKMNDAYGYHIQRTTKRQNTSLQAITPKFEVQCTECLNKIYRMKRSALIQHPERYRCRCGGELVVKIIENNTMG